MELTIPAYAKTISDTLKSRHAGHVTPAPAAARGAQPARRPLGRLFRRDTPSTFQRCLAVHMHFAQRASALD
ncbi:MAG TPA: hypothetical protein VE397_17610 [Stellaceae bacterium]|jgi:hypothetical protein|nr:hypothetical protein [Stellaceae bacterium]